MSKVETPVLNQKQANDLERLEKAQESVNQLKAGLENYGDLMIIPEDVFELKRHIHGAQLEIERASQELINMDCRLSVIEKHIADGHQFLHKMDKFLIALRRHLQFEVETPF